MKKGPEYPPDPDSNAGPPDEAQQIREFDEAVEYFRLHRDEIVHGHGGEYAAILNNNVVASGQDWVNLSKELHDRFGSRHLFVPHVDIESRPIKMGGPKRLVGG